MGWTDGALGVGTASGTASNVGATCVTGSGLVTGFLTVSGGGASIGGDLGDMGLGGSMICANTSTGTTTSTARINKPVCKAQIAKT